MNKVKNERERGIASRKTLRARDLTAIAVNCG